MKTSSVIAVASGKGGTGKTLVATNLARVLGDRAQIIDCDVEEPNVHLFLRPTVETITPFTLPVPEVDLSKCSFCGRCGDVCQYKAIVVVGKQVLTFRELCHGCGACSLVCPEGAIREQPRLVGVLEEGRFDGALYAAGRLRIGEPMAAPLIKAVRRLARDGRTVILDAPPGTSCPVVASLKGVDLCLLVTEPTPFGINDLMLALEVVEYLGLPHALVINRCDLSNGELEEICKRRGIETLMTLPQDRTIAEAYSRGQLIVESHPPYRKSFESLAKDLLLMVERNGGKGRGNLLGKNP
jgi:MinD superfamily P-loop ATPase